MASKDLHNNIETELVFCRQSVTNGSTITSTGFDSLGSEQIEFLINWFNVDASSINADTTIIKLQDSDDNSVFSDVDSEFVLGNPLATGDPVESVIYRIGYVGQKRFIRLVVTAPTGTNSWRVTSYLVEGVPLIAPTPESP